MCRRGKGVEGNQWEILDARSIELTTEKGPGRDVATGIWTADESLDGLAVDIGKGVGFGEKRG